MGSEVEFLAHASGRTDFVSAWIVRIYLLGLGCLLVAPGAIAVLRKHPNRHAIFAITLLFGMTGVVWGAMLTKSLQSVDDPDCRPLSFKAKLVLAGLTLGPFMIAGTLDAIY